ncbi:MAG: GNAT family N-acetyltransferase [Anaerolineae bacterium]|nr:GNAT family N-acetyltransferase [Anaerolineae bacterium]
MAALQIRPATLADVPGITAVHCSTVTVWRDPATRMAVPYAQLDLFGRWRNGGAWMSVEMAAVHVASLLQAGQSVMVATWAGEVIGEAEVYFTHEPGLYAVLHLSILYVHATWQGRGVGQALLEAGVNLARERGLSALTTQPDDAARGFYARHGFELWRMQHELQLETTTSQPAPALMPVTSSEHTPGPEMALRIGRYQCGPQGWEVLWPSLELPGWSDLRRSVWQGNLESGPAVLGLCQQLTDPTQADAYVWVTPEASLAPALRALQALAGAQGYHAVDVLLAKEDIPEARQHFQLGFQTQIELWQRRL